MITHTVIRSLVLCLTIFLHFVAAVTPVSAQGDHANETYRAQISPFLTAELRQQAAPISFLVLLDDEVNAADLPSRRQHTDLRRRRALYAALTEHAARTQRPLRHWLDARNIPYRAFYIVNMLEIRGDAALVEALSRRPEIRRIVANPIVTQTHHIADAEVGLGANHGWIKPLYAPLAQFTPTLPYGLLQTKAVDVWKMGHTGQGIWIASQDTGVEWEHPALKSRYRGWNEPSASADHRYNWFDAWDSDGRPARCVSDAQVPCDDHGHGTHTVGTMLGIAATTQPAVGMAPDAQWMGCRNMLRGVGTPASYTACFEFFLAPYPQDGDPFTDGRPELAPHIINNSWGCPPDEGCDAESLRQVVETVRAAGLFIISSAGNEGSSGCGSVRDPIAIYDEAVSVGAATATRTIAGFSSRGPVKIDGSGRMKPDLVAPGVGVYSASVNGGYSTLQGTSMAAPHVAGAIALLWSAVPELIGDTVRTEQILFKSAEPVPISLCGDGDVAVAPNNIFGYGHLDIKAAIELAQQPFDIMIEVLGDNTAGITDNGVTLVDTMTGHTYLPDVPYTGTVRFSRLVAGEYRVEIIDRERLLDGGILTVDPERGDYQTVTNVDEFTVHTVVDQVGPLAATVYLPLMGIPVGP